MKNQAQGFTIVEMLVTLFVGVLLVGVFYQLFVSIVQYGNNSRRDATASTVVNQILKKYPSTTSVSTALGGSIPACPTTSEVLPGPDQSGTDLSLGSFTRSLTACSPYTASPSVTLLKATVIYNNGTSSIKQAIYVN